MITCASERRAKGKTSVPTANGNPVVQHVTWSQYGQAQADFKTRL